MEFSNWKTHKDEFKKEKPLKYIYPDQEKAKKEFVNFILPYLEKHKFFRRVWIWGSLAKGKFGVYSKPYLKQEGSDVDLLVEVNEVYPIPHELKELKNWTKTRTYSRAFTSSLNFKRKISSRRIIQHKIDFICHFPSQNTKEGFYSKVKESKIIYNNY